MSGSTGYTYGQTGQVVPTQSLAYLVQQLKAAEAAQQAQAAAAAQNQATQTGGATGGAQTTPQATSASGTPSAATGGGGSPAGAVAAPSTPQMTPAQQTQAIESYLSGTAYPDIQSQIMAAYQRAVEGGSPTAGVLHGAPSTGIMGDVTGLGSLAASFLPGGLIAGIPMAALGLLSKLYTEKAPTLTATDAPWAGGSKGYATGEGGLGGLVSLPDPSASAGGATGQLAQQLGGGVSEAYPWGAGAPYTSGSGIYQFAPQMEPQGAPGTTQTAGNPAFFMPGSEPNTFYQTDYFGNVIGGPFNMSGAGSAPTGDRPLGFGAQEPGWLQQAFASDPAIAPGSGAGWAQAWGTQPTSQQLSGWGVASTTPDRGGGG